MKLFFKRVSVYFLCLLVAYLPVQRVEAAFPAAAVVLDILGGAAVATVGGHVVTKAICGLSPWAANDPVFACDAKTPKSTWVQKAKTSAKWGALFLALGYMVNSSTGVVTEHLGSCYDWFGSHLASNVTVQGCAQTWANYLGQSLKGHTFTREGSTYHIYVDTGEVNRVKLVAKSIQEVSDDELYDNFWGTSPDVPSETWLPPSSTEVPNPVHPDPTWFPEVEPKTQPFTPAVPAPDTQPYPKPLPETHPDYRPSTTPAPEVKPDYFPGALPGTWPEDWPLPGDVPSSPGDFPGVWPLPGSTPTTSPDTGTPTEPLPEYPFPVPLPVIGPLTRTDLEQVQAQNFQQATDGLPQADFSTPQDQITQAMNDFIADKVEANVPDFSFNPFGYFTFGGGECVAFHFDLSIGGNSRSVTFDSHCPPFNDFVRPTLEWYLYLSTALYIYMMFTRTVRSL